ncbi:uncharacterized protein LOC131431893 isoform X2 [Malaya genurostris]|uniref:uncharacterized protein LOC131431893 isoform X2 n=1 Tax=Malaya genurostris TaxID=325434 RepID=UPI0026F3D4D4|nr:uncharacterized protein LOC131431893 isoform X2 [Malaya genurostris]
MLPILIVCFQLMVAGSSTVWATPYVTFEQRNPSGKIMPHFGASKRQQSSVPTIIEPGNNMFSFRQHHRPVSPSDSPSHQPSSTFAGQQQQQLNEGYFGQQHEVPHFLQHQPNGNHPAHLSQDQHQHHYQSQPQQHQQLDFPENSALDPIAESLEQQEYDQPGELGSALLGLSPVSAEVENEIGDNLQLYNYLTGEDEAAKSNHLRGDGPSPNIGRVANNNNNPHHHYHHHNNIASFDLIRERLEQIKAEEDIEIKSNLLMKMLEQLPEGPLPIVYVEDAAGDGTGSAEELLPDDETGDDGVRKIGSNDSSFETRRMQQFTASGNKRSGRYYRRYPWKRQNARSRTYDADARYLCVPSRDDVFKLLVGLHENRIGNHQKTINFCNRKRPAKAIFTNIRFLG